MAASLWHHIPPWSSKKKLTPQRISKKCHKKLISVPCESYNYNMAHSTQTYTPCMSSPVQIWLNQCDQSHLSSAEFKYSPAMIPSTLDWPHIFVLVSTVVATSSSGERPGNGSHGGPTMVLPWSFQPRYLWPVANRHLKVLYLVALLWSNQLTTTSNCLTPLTEKQPPFRQKFRRLPSAGWQLARFLPETCQW